MDYPHYQVHWKTGTGSLLSDFFFQTPVEGYYVVSEKIELLPSGGLNLEEGYVWDFGSGPSINTPDMVYASLAHDALYELMTLDKLPWKERKPADKYFLELLKKTKMPWYRRKWVWLGVRYGYPILKALGVKGHKEKRG